MRTLMTIIVCILFANSITFSQVPIDSTYSWYIKNLNLGNYSPIPAKIGQILFDHILKIEKYCPKIINCVDSNILNDIILANIDSAYLKQEFINNEAIWNEKYSTKTKKKKKKQQETSEISISMPYFINKDRLYGYVLIYTGERSFYYSFFKNENEEFFELLRLKVCKPNLTLYR